MAKQKVAVIPEADKAANAQFRFSAGIRSGDLLHCSGQLGSDENGVIEDPEAQFDQAFRRVGAVLEEAGGSWDDVVEMTSFHVGLSAHLGTFMKVKARWITEPFPAWTAIGVSELALPGALVEVKVVADLG
jgi:enamine deaminase RidA (YjgF/YER057c/UK114 family)